MGQSTRFIRSLEEDGASVTEIAVLCVAHSSHQKRSAVRVSTVTCELWLSDPSERSSHGRLMHVGLDGKEIGPADIESFNEMVGDWRASILSLACACSLVVIGSVDTLK